MSRCQTPRPAWVVSVGPLPVIACALPHVELSRILDLVHVPGEARKLGLPCAHLFFMRTQAGALAPGVSTEYRDPDSHEPDSAEQPGQVGSPWLEFGPDMMGRPGLRDVGARAVTAALVRHGSSLPRRSTLVART